MKIPAPPTEADFTSRLRSATVAARVGLWLGVCFGICFLTGLLSHYAQNPDHPIPFPTSPSWGYRLTQGLHVVTGTASVPLLLVKLWSVFPRLFIRPPKGLRALTVEGLERASIGVLVAAAIFQLATGLSNSAQWYPWSFSFRTTHYAVAWVAIGALVVHIAREAPDHPRRADRGRRRHDVRPRVGDSGERDVATRAAADHLGRERRGGTGHGRQHGAVPAQGLGLRSPVGRGTCWHPDQQVRPGGGCHRRRP